MTITSMSSCRMAPTVGSIKSKLVTLSNNLVTLSNNAEGKFVGESTLSTDEW
jgi:hypothetical protein